MLLFPMYPGQLKPHVLLLFLLSSLKTEESKFRGLSVPFDTSFKDYLSEDYVTEIYSVFWLLFFLFLHYEWWLSAMYEENAVVTDSHV